MNENSNTPSKKMWKPLAALIVTGKISLKVLDAVLSLIIKIVLVIVLAVALVVKKFAKWVKTEWKKEFTPLTKDLTCEICGKHTGEPIGYSDCCDRFVHNSCHGIETLEKMLSRAGQGGVSMADLFAMMNMEE